jgi:DsbC/DsbD-like thiol-disulfide interchange protein
MKQSMLFLSGLLISLQLACAVNAQGADSSKVVKVEISKDPSTTTEEKFVVITFSVEPGYHIYANPVVNPDLASVQTSVGIKSEGKTVTAKVEYPAGKLVKDDVVGDYSTYEGTVKIKLRVAVPRNQTAPLEVVVKYQACSKKSCLAPAVATLQLP